MGNALTSSRWISRWAVSAVVGSVGGLSELASRKQIAWLQDYYKQFAWIPCSYLLFPGVVGYVVGCFSMGSGEELAARKQSPWIRHSSSSAKHNTWVVS